MKESKVVYLHRRKTDYTIFYVGMGNKDRAYTTHSRNKWWKNTCKKYGFVVDIVAENLSIEDAYELEVFLISELGRKDKGLGNLVNLDEGGKGATGHIPTQSAREKLSKRTSKKVINTTTLEVLRSGTILYKKYNIRQSNLRKEHPSYDWMYLDDYNNGKHLTEKWINRYRIKNSYLKIINTETLEVFYSIKEAVDSEPHYIPYSIFTQKLKGVKKNNNTNFMYYEHYLNNAHLTDQWKNRKTRKINTRIKPHKQIEIYDFKKQVWFKTTNKEFKDKYNQETKINTTFCKGRFCRKGYPNFDKVNSQWKNILDKETGIIERFNQIGLADNLNTKSNNLSNFFLNKSKTLYKRYVIVENVAYN